MAIIITRLMFGEIICKPPNPSADNSIIHWLWENVGPKIDELEFTPERKEPNELVVLNGYYRIHDFGKGWVIDHRIVMVPNKETEAEYNVGLCAPRQWSPLVNEDQYRLHFRDDIHYVQFKLRWSA
jgi:hypothetical protein